MAAFLAAPGLALGAGTAGAQPGPGWTDALLRASRIETPGAAALSDRPRWRADPLNVFVVIEAGDDHVSLLDGDRLEVFHRFPTRPVHGEPVFTPDGRFVYLGSPDGWIAKYDIWNLTAVAEVRAGLDLNGLAVSGDGRWLIAASSSPATVALFDPDLRLVRTYPLSTLDGRIDSRAAAVYDAAPRQSFIVALKDIAELWEISYNVRAEPIFDGLVHDYRMGEGISKPGFHGVRRVPLEEPMQALLFDPSYRNAIGATRASPGDRAQARVVNLDVRRVIAGIAVAGVPHLQAGVGFSWNERAVLAFASLGDAVVTVVDTKTWRIVATIATSGSGSCLSSHRQAAHVWVGCQPDTGDARRDRPGPDSITLIDKRTLAAVGPLREPARTLSHVEFTQDGRFALASVGGTAGAIVALDARSLREVKRVSMRNPARLYNVGNRIGRAGPEPAR